MAENEEVPVDEWVDIPKGMIAAPNTYVDAHGVLRHSGNHAIAVWHNRTRGNPPCPVKVTRPDEICYDTNGAPWCWACFQVNRIKYDSGSRHVRWCGKNYPRWFADSSGNVYKDKQTTPQKASIDKRGYFTVSDMGLDGLKTRHVFVANLVATAFLGERPEGFVCRHLNDKKQDNRIENLAWGSQSENMLDCVRNGKHPRLSGELNPSSILTQDEVVAIREEYKGRHGDLARLARKYNVHKRTIGRIINFESWRDSDASGSD